MTLWSKPLSDVTFDDVQVFCEQEIPEGTQLDYKREIPNDFAKYVASLANTAGGLILIGVAEESTKPVLPINGMGVERGLVERITQLCRDGIYPAVSPEVSTPLPLPGNDQRCVLVVRVDQSLESPHMLTNSNRIYIRTRDSSHPAKPEDAGVIHLERMFDTKRRGEQRRQELIRRMRDRLATMTEGKAAESMHAWCSISPVFDLGSIVAPEDCFNLCVQGRRQRVADGGVSLTDGGHSGLRGWHTFRGAGQHGDSFVATNCGLHDGCGDHFRVLWIARLVRQTTKLSLGLLRKVSQAAGLLTVELAVENCVGYRPRITDINDLEHPIIDQRLTAATVVQSRDLIDGMDAPDPPAPFEYEVLREINHACGFPDYPASTFTDAMRNA